MSRYIIDFILIFKAMKKKSSIASDDSKNQLGFNDNYLVTQAGVEVKIQVHIKTEDKKNIILHNKMRWLIFVLFFFMTTLVNVDHGTVPAATLQIETDLEIGEKQLGLFGSLVFLGNLLGSIFSFSLINRFNRKLLLIISLVLNGVCLWTFTLTKAYWFLVINRIVVGIFQVKLF